jgi:hypothetical protein
MFMTADGHPTKMYNCCSVNQKKIIRIGYHVLSQGGSGLGTPEGAEGRGATRGNTGRGQQRERAQATVHQTSSKQTFTSRHGRISNRSPNQKDIAGKNRAHSSRNRVGTSGQEAERIRVLHPNGIPTFFERLSENPNASEAS